MLAFDACNYPITRTNVVTAFQRVNPSVKMHYHLAMLADFLTAHIRASEISDDSAFTRFAGCFSCILERTHHIVFWMVAVFEPLRCVDDDGFLAVFHAAPGSLMIVPSGGSSFLSILSITFLSDSTSGLAYWLNTDAL